ncbi:hypothetical protein NicSoilB4_20990 [Arthrobacter sp. NicSoilB4]|nr:hypothetical protein NicSoilB4_20990 [Arthrobacter sp. NicSoilB4]
MVVTLEPIIIDTMSPGDSPFNLLLKYAPNAPSDSPPTYRTEAPADSWNMWERAMCSDAAEHVSARVRAAYNFRPQAPNLVGRGGSKTRPLQPNGSNGRPGDASLKG